MTTKEQLLAHCPNKETFCLLFSKLLQERFPHWSIVFAGETRLHIVHSEGKESTTYLENLWLKYSRDQEDRSELLEKYVRMIDGMGSAGSAATRANTVAMIKDSKYMSLFEPHVQVMNEHLCGDIYIVYAIDSPETIRTLSRAEMETMGLTSEELRPLAVENLKRLLPSVECHGDGPWFLLTAGGDYVASLLLLDDLWDELANTVDGSLVATVPTRDVLMYTGTESKDGITEIRRRSLEISESGSHAISSSLLLRTGGLWEMFNAN